VKKYRRAFNDEYRYRLYLSRNTWLKTGKFFFTVLKRMFSSKTLRYVSYIVRFGCKIRFLPFSIVFANNGNAILKIQRLQSLDWIIWILGVGAGCLFTIVRTISLIEYCLRVNPNAPGTSSGESGILFDILVIVALSYGFVFHLNTILYGESIADFFTHVITLNRLLRKSIN